MNVVIERSPIAPAAIGIAQSAGAPTGRHGSNNAPPTSCRLNTSMWYSPCPSRLPGWHSRTSKWFMASCSRPQPKPCSKLAPTQNTSAPASVFWPCSTPGDRTCIRTLTHNAWHHHLLDFQGTTQVDFPCDPLVDGACLSDGDARECYEPALSPDRSDEFPKEHAGRLVRGSIGRPPPAVRWNGDSRRIAELLHSS